MEYFFESKKTDNFVRIKNYNSNTVEIINYHVDGDEYDNILEFCELLKHAIEQAEKDGYEYFMQHVDKIEWNENLKKNDKWELICEDENSCKIVCCISDAAECVINAFFIN